MQVYDLLIACGLTIGSSLLPQLFPYFEHAERRALLDVVKANITGASRELLEACVLHGDGASGYRYNNSDVNKMTRITTLLYVLRPWKQDKDVMTFVMWGARRSEFALTIPDRGKPHGTVLLQSLCDMLNDICKRMPCLQHQR